MDDPSWISRPRREQSPRVHKARDERRKRRKEFRDIPDRITIERAERRRVRHVLTFLDAHGGDINERLEARIAAARRERHEHRWQDLETRRDRSASSERDRLMDYGMRWFYLRWRARSRSPERYSDDSLARYVQTLTRTAGRFALPLALRWERWLSRDLEYPSDRLAFFGGVAPCNFVVAQMLASRPALRGEIEAWIHRTRQGASPEEIRAASWITSLQGSW